VISLACGGSTPLWILAETHTTDESKAPSPLRFAGALQIRPRQRTIENSPGLQAWVNDEYEK